MKKQIFKARRVDSMVAPAEYPFPCNGGIGAIGSWITVLYCWDIWFPS
jgi:hypothetical protein